jgi:hypothetical protein
MNIVECQLFEVEPSLVFESLDIRSINTENISNFPSEEFGEFMKLIIKWNLSDTCSGDILRFLNKVSRDDTILPTSIQQGKQLLDKIMVPYISFKKVPIMEYEEETYYLNYRPIFDCIKELLTNKDILNHCVFEFTPLYYEEQRIYNEQFNGEWWENVQKTIPSQANVLSIMLYSDATTCDQLGKTNEHPVYLTLGNIPSWRRNKPDAKVLLAYLPIIKPKSATQKNSSDFLFSKRFAYQHSWDVILKPILDYKDNGFDLQTNNGDIWCYPFVSVFLGDIPEHSLLTLTYNSVNCKCPCHGCMVSVNKMNDIKLNDNQIISRTPEQMKIIINQGLTKQHSIYNMENIFWKYP